MTTKEKILTLLQNINYYYNDCTMYDSIKNLLEEMKEPEIVRCMDCVHCFHRDNYELWCEGRGFPYQLVNPDGFCDKGKGVNDGKIH